MPVDALMRRLAGIGMQVPLFYFGDGLRPIKGILGKGFLHAS
jgi:hypothetical protein